MNFLLYSAIYLNNLKMRTFNFFLTVFVGLVLVASSLNAQHFRYIRPSDGLNTGEINDFVQDREGRMWIATWTGLICYDGYDFKHFRPVMGDTTSISDKKVKKLLLDSEGNIWIATQQNLNRLDLKTFEFTRFSFERESDEPLNILDLNELSENIVVHTVDGMYFVPVDLTAERHLVKKLPVYDGKQQLSEYFHFSESINNNQLVCVSNSGTGASLYYLRLSSNYNRTMLKVEMIDNLSTSVNGVFHKNDDPCYYLPTNNGIYEIELDTRNIRSDKIFSNRSITRLYRTLDNVLYASSGGPVIYSYDVETKEENVMKANPSQKGMLLNSNVLCFFEDFSNNLWIGHQGQGISVLDLTRKSFVTIKQSSGVENSLSSNTIMSFESNDDYLIVGCRTGGIDIIPKMALKKSDLEIEVLKPRSNSNRTLDIPAVWDIVAQDDTTFWIGANTGLYRLVYLDGQWIAEHVGRQDVFSNSIRKLFIDKNSNMWVGTMDNGLFLVPDLNTNNDMSYYRYAYAKEDKTSLTSNVILDIYLDSSDRLWIGTVNGLNLLETPYDNLQPDLIQRPSLSFKQIEGYSLNDEGLNNNEINCIYENYDGKIWVATQGGGVNIIDPLNWNFDYLDESNGLPGNDVFGILSDREGNLWISTQKGLARFNQDIGPNSITVFDENDGIQGNVFMINSFHKTKDGMLVFGGENGLTIFDPAFIKSNRIKPNTIFTDLFIDDKLVGIGDTIGKNMVLDVNLNEMEEIVLPYQNNTFSIAVSPIHYKYPQGNKIAYMLENYHSGWKTISAAKNPITFSKIPAGNYTLRVYGISSDDIAESEIKRLKVHVLPPWYQTWYARALFMSAFIAVVTIVVVIVINRQKQKYLNKVYEISLENNETKMTFLANIAHELKTPLSLVISPIDDMINNIDEINKRWHNDIFLIHRNSNYIQKLINQIIDFRRLDAGKLELDKAKKNIIEIIREVATNFKSFESKQGVTIHLEVPEEPVMMNMDRQKIEEVLYNLLSNAFKYTTSQGQIKISLNVIQADEKNINQNVMITVFNEGRVVDDDEIDHLFERFYKTNESAPGTGIGLSFAQSLVEMHNGKIWAEPVERKGMNFKVLLPCNQNGSDYDKDANEKVVSEIINIEQDDIISERIFVNDEENKIISKVLIVEDNSELREYLVNLLSRWYNCYEAVNGKAGLDKTFEIIPDVIITDAVMPRIDGYIMIERIRADMKTCHIPILMLTAKSASENFIDGYKAGVDAYVAKPFNTNVILSQISRLIKNRKLIHAKYKKENFMVDVPAKVLSRDDEFLQKVRSLLDKNLDNPAFNVGELAVEMKMSTTQLYRKIKALTNYSPVEFLRIARLHKAHEFLAERDLSIKEVCFRTGFNNLSYFVKCFREYFGITPANYRDSGTLKKE
jgi:signal transduction histidine kinase/ligand-binding sensor domain-containing protein/DNA-binding response OmpR family regulator